MFEEGFFPFHAKILQLILNFLSLDATFFASAEDPFLNWWSTI